MSKKVSTVSKRRLTVFGTLSVIAIIYFIISLFYNTFTLFSLLNEKKQMDEEYLLLQEETEKLTDDIEKFNDEEYLANYARENYLYSKDGEYILKMSDTTDLENEIDILSSKFTRNCVILALSIIMLFIFGYIILKGKKRIK